MTKIVILFACVALANVASALECYSCSKDECSKDMSTWGKVSNCGKTADPQHVGACLKQIFTDKVTNKEMTNRRCVLAEKSGDKASFKCNDLDGKSSTCEVCTTDYCNSAPGVNFSFVALLGVVAAYLVPRFM